MPDRALPEWFYSSDERTTEDKRKEGEDTPAIGDPPLIHLLPQLRAFLELKDPEHVDRAMELLVNCQSEEELFADLQAQYGNVDVDDVEKVSKPSGKSEAKKAQSSKSRSSSHATARSHIPRKHEDKDLDDFIVPDSEEDVESEEEEDEFEIVPLDSNSRRNRSRSPKRSATPQVVCKYGKACYRKNPVHFREFAHPWLPNNGLP